MSGFRFDSPFWLLLLLPLAAGFWWSERVRKRRAVLYSSALLVRDLPVTPAQRIYRRLPWLWLAGAVGVVLALARPQQGHEEFRVRAEGIAIQMCIDRSGSMQALDFELEDRRVNRLVVVKKVFKDFVAGAEGLPGRPDDRIGLIAFGGFAEALCPATLDHTALLHILETVQIPAPIRDARGRIVNERLLEEEMATAIGDALTLGLERLRNDPAKSRILILLSDGENTAGVVPPEQAAEAARVLGVKVYTIGVGTTGRVPFPATDESGRTVMTTQMVRLDEATLQKIAETTGGKYFRASDTESLVKVYAEIDALEKTATEGRLFTEYRELYPWALWPATALLLIECLLTATRFRTLD